MLVISSPSGAGKTTLTRMLVEHDPNLQLSISVTTRPRRTNEQDGTHYHFIDKQRFDAMNEAGELIESAQVFENFYGTPREPLETALASGRDVVFDIDWQGARQLQAQAPHDLATVFILPPSRAILEQRLRNRGADDEETVQRRMDAASDEMSHWSEYHYVIVNDDLERSAAALQAILEAERLKQTRSHGLSEFLLQLMNDA